MSVRATPSVRNFLRNHQSRIAAVGIKYETFGEGSIVVTALPQLIPEGAFRAWLTERSSEDKRNKAETDESFLWSLALSAAADPDYVLSDGEMFECLRNTQSEPWMPKAKLVYTPHDIKALFK